MSHSRLLPGLTRAPVAQNHPVMPYPSHRPAHGLLREQRVLIVLMGIIGLIFLAQLFLGAEILTGWMAVPAKVENAVVAIRSGGADAASWQALATVLTCAFLHMDLEHVTGNLLFLWIFAGLVRRLVHEVWIPIVFVLTAIAGSMLHVFLNRGEVLPMLGASGAVLGFEGLYLGLATRGKLPQAFIWPLSQPVSPTRLMAIAVIGVGLDYFNLVTPGSSNVAFGAHLGGFVMGLLLGVLVLPRPTVEGPMRTRWR